MFTMCTNPAEAFAFVITWILRQSWNFSTFLKSLMGFEHRFLSSNVGWQDGTRALADMFLPEYGIVSYESIVPSISDTCLIDLLYDAYSVM